MVGIQFFDMETRRWVFIFWSGNPVTGFHHKELDSPYSMYLSIFQLICPTSFSILTGFLEAKKHLILFHGKCLYKWWVAIFVEEPFWTTSLWYLLPIASMMHLDLCMIYPKAIGQSEQVQWKDQVGVRYDSQTSEPFSCSYFMFSEKKSKCCLG